MKKIYVVDDNKDIIGMDNIVGPLTTPTVMKFIDVLEMVKKGYNIYQVNPYNHSEKVKVTLNNIHNITFSGRSAATTQKMLNRSIQAMEKGMVVNVVEHSTNDSNKKNTSNKNENKTSDLIDKKENKNKAENETVKDEKLTAPDAFTK